MRERLLGYFPPEDVISFTSLTDKALLYMPDGFEHKILSMGEAQNSKEVQFQDMLLRELMSEKRLRHMVPMKYGDEIRTEVIEKRGPVVFIVTTTATKLNPENETRMLSLEVNESEAQTRKVLRKIAETEGLNRNPVATGTFREWQDFQRWLAAGERQVFIPFADTLATMIGATRSVRLRRDFSQLLRAIKAHALLHREHRRRSRRGAIVATIADDYGNVRELMADVMATAAEVKMRTAIENTVMAVKEIATLPRSPGATVRVICTKLRIDRSTAYRRLRQAEDGGFIQNMEERKGRPARYEPTGETPADIEMLPEAEHLSQAYEDHRTSAKIAPAHPALLHTSRNQRAKSR
jgi:hypothetical protein